MDQNSLVLFSSSEAQLLISSDRIWMMLMCRRLDERMSADRQLLASGRTGHRTAADLSGYVRVAGPIPKYADDPVAAQRYHDDMIMWFWSKYSIALAELNRDQPFTIDAKTVLNRLRFKALMPARDREAA